MKLWSRGLGRTEVTMDFRYYKVIKDKKNGDVVIIGNMQDPVTWEFTMKMEPDDIAGVMKILFSFTMLAFVFKNAFRYIKYLFERKKFILEDDEDLETKVLGTYEKMMSNKPRKKRRGKRGGSNGEKPEADASGAAQAD